MRTRSLSNLLFVLSLLLTSEPAYPWNELPHNNQLTRVAIDLLEYNDSVRYWQEDWEETPPTSTFWQRVNWSLVGVLFILTYCTLLAVIVFVVKKTRPALSNLADSEIIESLVVLFPDGERKTVSLPEKRMSIGRHASNMLMLIDSKASSFHAEIIVKSDGYVVKDLGSTNGILVNDEKVTKKVLHPGDVIKIGQTTITAS